MNREELNKTHQTLTEGLDILQKLQDDTNNGSAWPALTGLPESILPKLLEWAVVKDVEIEDLLLTVAGIAFAHGKKVSQIEATEGAKVASEGL